MPGAKNKKINQSKSHLLQYLHISSLNTKDQLDIKDQDILIAFMCMFDPRYVHGFLNALVYTVTFECLSSLLSQRSCPVPHLQQLAAPAWGDFTYFTVHLSQFSCSSPSLWCTDHIYLVNTCGNQLMGGWTICYEVFLSFQFITPATCSNSEFG